MTNLFILSREPADTNIEMAETTSSPPESVTSSSTGSTVCSDEPEGQGEQEEEDENSHAP